MINFLDKNTAYMIRNDGKIFQIKGTHPYILYDEGDFTSFSEELEGLADFGVSWPIWFYEHTLLDSTKSKIIRAIKYLADVLCSENLEIPTYSSYREFGLDSVEEISTWLNYFHITPEKLDQGVTSKAIRDVNVLFEELNDVTNQEFLRCRTGGMFFQENNPTIYFRVSSIQFNWFDIIWEIVYHNQYRYNYVTIVEDKPSGKTIEDDKFYIIDGNIMNQYPILDFINLKGHPLIEFLDHSYSRALIEGKSFDEAYGDCGPYHNCNKFKANKLLYVKDNFRTLEEFQKEFGKNNN